MSEFPLLASITALGLLAGPGNDRTTVTSIGGNATRVRLSDGSVTEAMITHFQPTVTEEAVRGGFLELLRTEGVLRWRETRAYNAKVSYLLSPCPWG